MKYINNKKFIIVCLNLNINHGGVICLNYLCHLLNSLNYESYLYVINNYNNKYNLNLNINFIKNKDIEKNNINDYIVIYPEIIDHNPLNAKKIVRWLLHKPGFHTNRINFGVDDLIVAYIKNYQGSYEIDEKHILNIKYIMNNTYYNRNLERTKTCYSIRKGAKSKPNLKLVHKEDSICIDGKDHKEISDIFNQSHTFISYDTYSTFSIYAALCGATSIVIPDEGVSKKDWYHDIKNTYGIAYGLDDIQYAEQTKDLLYQYIRNQEQENIDMVQNFVALCDEYFNIK